MPPVPSPRSQRTQAHPSSAWNSPSPAQNSSVRKAASGTGAAESTNCADGIDNDADGVSDCQDPDCWPWSTLCGEIVPVTPDDRPAEDSLSLCTDLIDNDGDGLIDVQDTVVVKAPVARRRTQSPAQLLRIYCRHPEPLLERLRSLEIAVHAAAPCPVPVKEQMIAWWGPIIHEYYGATEGLGFTACDTPEWLAHRGSVGRVLLGALPIVALLLATVMVNVAPENPYLHNMLQIWNPGQFLNFNGLTRLVSSLWPFLALPWLMTYRPRKNDSDY